MCAHGPIYTVPSEVLSHIFLLNVHNGTRVFPSSSSGPLLLGRVCKLWRELTCSTPALWSELSIPAEFRSWFQADPGLKDWMLRSRNSLLHIQIDNVDVPTWFAVLDAILPHCTRWEQFYCYHDSRHVQDIFEKVTEFGGLPKLKELHLATSPPSPYWRLNALATSPNLTSVSASHFKLPLAQTQHTALKCLHQVGVTSNLEIQDTIELLPHLESLSVKLREYVSFGIPLEQPVRHANLKHFSLKMDMSVTEYHLAHLLDSIQLTGLVTFEVLISPVWKPESYQALWTNFARFLDRSSSPLETFSINADLLTKESLVECFKHAPSLRVANFRIQASEGILRALTRSSPPMERDLLPHLQELTMFCSEDMDEELFYQMLESRWDVPEDSRLREVTVYQRDERDEDELGHVGIRAMVEQGLALRRKVIT